MAFYRSFIKFLRFNFIGAIIILTIYLSLNDIYNLNRKFYKTDATIIPFPNSLEIRKIDVGQGNDIWILTTDNYLYHWCTIQERFIFINHGVIDFSVASDGSVTYVDSDRDIYIRKRAYNWWLIDFGSGYDHENISICNHDTIFTTNIRKDLIKGVYDNQDGTFKWKYVDFYNNYDQISCALHDKSLWFTDHYAHLFINGYRSATRSEVSFMQIKALSEQHAIGIDLNHSLWEYTKGTWKLIRNNVKSASINYDGDIFYVDNNNVIYKIKSTD